ncbi:cell death abnormality protein 1-like isoform X2 [Argopecten irradians]|uniref:cell death abnormality protein 1-like isoform X2 n=1 Tax=Argopecten irradians TaxID=31199 RepID=UPI00371E85C0
MARCTYIESCYSILLIIAPHLATVRSEGNIALSKTATQSTNRSSNEWLASAAVDGCQNIDMFSGCCGHTQAGLKTAWWRVDLGQISTIDSIHIIYRDSYQLRLAGYELYVSNTTVTPRDGILCYQDTSTTEAAVQLNIIHQCPYVGRYVTVYNYRNTPKRYSWYNDYAVLELCEVLVYGCPAGKYGDGDCSQICPATCYGGNCNPKIGSCFYCAVGTFGVFCENTCSLDCMNGLCDTGTGNCLECVPGKFGATCSQDCSINCKGTGCAKDTGYCYGCVDGKYGDTCDVDCSVNCKDRLCDGNTGYCGDCIVGRYGVNCSNNCPAGCKDNVCYIDTGFCNECLSGKFGNTCNQDCSINCKDTLCVHGRRGLYRMY